MGGKSIKKRYRKSDKGKPGREGRTHTLLEIEGMFCVDNRSYDDVFDINFTSDAYGEVISIRTSNLMIILPYEEIERFINEVREERGIPRGI